MVFYVCCSFSFFSSNLVIIYVISGRRLEMPPHICLPSERRSANTRRFLTRVRRVINDVAHLVSTDFMDPVTSQSCQRLVNRFLCLRCVKHIYVDIFQTLLPIITSVQDIAVMFQIHVQMLDHPINPLDLVWIFVTA